jgi:hypothetical protein
MGFIWERGSYLRDPWNMIDFLVEVTGCPIRRPCEHCVRPLKSLNKVPGLQALVVAMLRAIPS